MVMQFNVNNSSEIILVIFTNYHIDSKHYLSTLSPFVFYIASLAFSVVCNSFYIHNSSILHRIAERFIEIQAHLSALFPLAAQMAYLLRKKTKCFTFLFIGLQKDSLRYRPTFLHCFPSPLLSSCSKELCCGY